MIPTPLKTGDGLYRVYFSGRDDKNRSHVGYATLDFSSGVPKVEYNNDPVLIPGRLGCFDDNGVTPSCALELDDGKIGLYYIGWNPGSTVRMHLFGGLAISSDGGDSFERWSEAPILERTRTDPFLNTAPWVIKIQGGFRMYYVSGAEWKHRDLPRYNIKTAFSEDGFNWVRNGEVCIDFADHHECALARPFVRRIGNQWEMWFSAKSESTNYQLYYARSADGVIWERLPEPISLVGSYEFDNDMVEYGCVISHNGIDYMLYNGNNYGYCGIGWAIRE